MQQQQPQPLSIYDSYLNLIHFRRQIFRQDLLELKDKLTKENLAEIEDRYMDATREMYEAIIDETISKKTKYDDFRKETE